MAGKIWPSFAGAIMYAIEELDFAGERVDAGRWQGIPTEGKPDLMTIELLDLNLSVNMDRPMWNEGLEGDYVGVLADEIQPNLPWADEHFAERVGGIPLNPDPSHVNWPWWRGQDAETKDIYGQFTHTYSERFWPRHAGYGDEGPYRTFEGRDNHGIRYPFGDYGDILRMLATDPYTRQAYLPIFFPEDTGAVHGGRIPCTLGYHFLLRSDRLHCWYEIRSCDAVRHFRDDLYLAARLVAHTINQLLEAELRSDQQQVWDRVNPGILFFKCHSFHVHMGDYHLLKESHE